MKKKFISVVLVLLLGVTFQACEGVLDKEPLNIVTEDDLLSGESGVTAYLASLYDLLPIEDFGFSARDGFNQHGSGSFLCHMSDEALYAFGSEMNSVGDGTWLAYWNYKGMRHVNNLIQKLPQANLSEELKASFLGEAKFVRAYYYFGMVKRYGGVPLITEVQNWTGDNLDELQVPRNTEEEVYDFIAKELDEAIALLQETTSKVRANKSAARALKSRAMLYAASIAKYGQVDLDGLVGIPSSSANTYWQASFDAAKAIIDLNKYQLYNANADKVANFQNLFVESNQNSNQEVIFAKYFFYPNKCHSYDRWNLPFTVRSGQGYGSRIGPTVELAEQYEYIDGSPGTLKLKDGNGNPIVYENPVDLFANKDPRFLATYIVPFSEWRGTPIDVQAGIIDQGREITAGNTSTYYNPDTHQIDNKNGTIRVIGMSGIGTNETSQSGLYIRKYLNPTYDRSFVGQNTSSTAFLDFRYGEILLNYAEAAIELGKVAEAKWALNLIRARAGIRALEDAEVTRDKVRHERQVELAFESHRYWDIRRWRIATDILSNTSFMVLLPYLNLDENGYIFKTRASGSTRTFTSKLYYEKIAGAEIGRNPKLIQNPGY